MSLCLHRQLTCGLVPCGIIPWGSVGIYRYMTCSTSYMIQALSSLGAEGKRVPRGGSWGPRSGKSGIALVAETVEDLNKVIRNLPIGVRRI